MLVNSGLAARLRGEEALVGLVLKMPSPAMVEMCAYAGFDLAVLDTEHGAWDGVELEHHIRAAESADLDVLVRVGGLSSVDVLRTLDAGAVGVVVPHVTTADQAAAAVRAAHYPPLGQRSLALSTRAGRQGFADLAGHLQEAADKVIVVVQVEDVAALPNVQAIASTPQVDAVFLGPSDLSLSLGHPGEMSHPAVSSAVDQVCRAVKEAGSAALCVLAQDDEDALAWQQKGAQVVLFAATAVMARTFSSLVEAVRGAPP